MPKTEVICYLFLFLKKLQPTQYFVSGYGSNKVF